MVGFMKILNFVSIKWSSQKNPSSLEQKPRPPIFTLITSKQGWPLNNISLCNCSVLGLKNHFDQMEADKVQMKLEMKRVKDENDWLRDELEETEKKLHEALGKITDLEEEKRSNDFLKEVQHFQNIKKLCKIVKKNFLPFYVYLSLHLV